LGVAAVGVASAVGAGFAVGALVGAAVGETVALGTAPVHALASNNEISNMPGDRAGISFPLLRPPASTRLDAARAESFQSSLFEINVPLRHL
jgi:hypothetical protein